MPQDAPPDHATHKPRVFSTGEAPGSPDTTPDVRATRTPIDTHRKDPPQTTRKASGKKKVRAADTAGP